MHIEIIISYHDNFFEKKKKKKERKKRKKKKKRKRKERKKKKGKMREKRGTYRVASAGKSLEDDLVGSGW